MSLISMPLIKLAISEEELLATPYEEVRSVEMVPSVAAKVSALPAFLGNRMASGVSGTSDLSKALLSILAGTGAGMAGMNQSKDYMLSHGSLGELGVMAAGILASGGGSYLTRRVLDSFGSQASPTPYR